jgi:D-lactate dehydrogenase
MKIGFFDIEGWEKPIVEKRLSTHSLFFSEDRIDEFHIPKKNDFEVLSVFVDSRITEKVLEYFPNLKFVCTRSTGFDHIDLAAAGKKDVLVSYVPGYGEHTVAEFTFGLILSLTRKIYDAMDRIREKELFLSEGLRGTEINGKTLGVVGTGRIGKRVIQIANGFSMKVIAHDPYPDGGFREKNNFEYVSFEDLLKRADIITFHVPYNKSTYHMLNKNNIGKVKSGALIINTARGGIIETEALIYGLKNGIIGGAALDVLEEEGEIKDELEYLTRVEPKAEQLRTMLYDHILMETPNVLITPHTAFNSDEALKEILETTLQSIEGFVAQTPINLVPKAK